MRAVVGRSLGALENFSIEPWDCAPPGEDEIQVEVYSAGVTYVDAFVTTGRYQSAVALPFVPGSEAAGRVVSVGENVSRFNPGDRVACFAVGGKYADRINVRQSTALSIPDRMTFDEASVFRGGFGCAYHALVQGANLRPGERVLVLGAAGAVGLAAVRLATTLGARVIASASSEEKRQLTLRYGADAAIDTYAADWRERLREWTGSNGLDVVVDPLGGDVTERAFRALGLGGRHLVIGFAAGKIPSLPTNLALVKTASLIGIELSKFEQRFPERAASNDRALIELYSRGAISAPPIAHRFALEQFREALTLAATGQSAGSIVLKIKEA